jgi:hypothetical protein
MALAFPNASRGFDAKRRAVRFWGYDSQFEFTFSMSMPRLCSV